MMPTITVLDNTPCRLGEGPTYDPLSHRAFWFDILGRKLFEHDFHSNKTLQHDLPVMSSMLGIIDDQFQLMASENGLYKRHAKTGVLEMIQPIEADNSATRSNDGRVHQCGALWIGTMGKKAQEKAGSIYHFFKGKLTRLYSDITIPNSMCFSPDGKTAYFTDTDINRMMQVEIDPNNGLPLGQPNLLYDPRLIDAENKGGLDGAIVDTIGNIHVACWGGSCIKILSPAGRLLSVIDLPATQITCPAFVGPDFSKMLVTSAYDGMTMNKLSPSKAGQTFLIEGDFQGRAEPFIVL